MTKASASELRRLRLAAQGLAAERPSSVTDAARRLLAVQAQDLPAARWALGARVPDSVDQDVTDAIDSGALVRHWPLRGTLQLVTREDLRWLLELTAERQWRAAARIRESWGVTVDLLATARQASVAALEGGRALTRAELSTVLETAGVAMGGGRGYQVISALAITGTLVWAASSGSTQRLALLDEWVPAAPAVDRDEALERLVTRYLAGHGPATAADLVWWAGIPVSWVRRGADAARVGLLEVDGTSYLIDQASAPPPAPRGALLLPAFDEYLLGYQQRDLVLPPRYRDRVAPQRNGRFLPIVVSAGRIVGTWSDEGDTVRARPFDEASPLSAASVARSAERYRLFRAAAG
ncbi:winged helix DNA-binding domain-containing protein [Gryllotalpicola daejeonensis]|uniref:Winged helix DNA-binding domain-containing protein n=1 Tax=Gryllotalpicola daejeonensis TaxID=993087 RepID=A0ABP7ZFL0_9MICO